MTEHILLGYEVDTGKEVDIENTHLLVTGLTNKSGKTTTIQALADRSGRKVLVFATKPGESVFEGEHVIEPFYQEKSDWQYVESILQAVMKEKMRFERAWIIRATKGTKTLRDVDFNCKRFASGSKEGSLENNIFSNLHAYFEIVLPQLERVKFAPEFPAMEVGINVMDLTGMREEVQSLVIRACLDHISHEESGIVTVIPELWKFAPEGRGNPVKAALEFLIRQGATRKNFVWMDSQDLAGVDKLPLKQVYTWILGLQTERNEVQHTLDQMPLPKKSRPGADAIMTLDVGHFILASPKGVKTVYVRPSWLNENDAQRVAKGDTSTLVSRAIIVGTDRSLSEGRAGSETSGPSREMVPERRSEASPGREATPNRGEVTTASPPRPELTVSDKQMHQSIKSVTGLTWDTPEEMERFHKDEQGAKMGTDLTPENFKPVVSAAMTGTALKELMGEPKPKAESIGAFTLQVTRLESESFIAKVVYILNRLGHSAQRKEILEAAREYGWASIESNFNRDIAPHMGTLIIRNEAGAYRLPKEVKVEEIVAR